MMRGGQTHHGGISNAKTVAFLAVAAILIAAALLIEGVQATARGWLICFGVVSQIPIGSLVLLMIHRLSGGVWGSAFAPVLRPAALCVPLAALALIPIALAAHVIYPWLSSSNAMPEVHIYLNTPAFLARAALALIGWSILGLIFGLGLGGQLLAALGLAFYGLTISFVSVDWFLSVDPHYTSTAFGAMIGIQQILAALAATALLSPKTIPERNLGDLASFLLAGLLGVVYLELMTFIVDWYGNLPDKAAWYLARSHDGWVAAITACACLALLSFAMLLLPSVRKSRGLMRIAGALIFSASTLHLVWLIAPSLSEQGRLLVAAALCGAALVPLSVLITSWRRSPTEAVHAHAG
jgi:hypothetical protein